MTRQFLALAAAFVLAGIAAADDKKEPAKPTVDLSGSVADLTQMQALPPGGVVVSAAAWEKLAKAWGIADAPKVDFTKELLVVATTRGGRLTLTPKVDDQGDLKAAAISTRDLRPGFRYAIKSVARAGVKTVNGKPLPKE